MDFNYFFSGQDAIKCEYQKWRRFYCEPKSGGMAGHESDEDRAGDRDPEWDALFLRFELYSILGRTHV